ncbi:unnamed protein product [Paramecium primaurelia]|uniref:Uncharacterized protein n=1 Tax=Paramecium primaurelia TaxID=5886 RepID=A0A8S1JTS5_PARPR|nr:unnamed protein product [Paramecium primaurelia]
MIYVPIIESLQVNKTIENDRFDASPNFQRFKLNNLHQNHFSLACKINNTIKATANKNSVVFGSSQDRKRPSKLILPSLQYDLNFKSVDRHKASPKIRGNRTNRIKSEKSDKQCCHSPLINKTETIVQTIQTTELNYLQNLIQRVKTPRVGQQHKISLRQDEFIPMNSQELKESLISLMNKYGLKQR